MRGILVLALLAGSLTAVAQEESKVGTVATQELASAANLPEAPSAVSGFNPIFKPAIAPTVSEKRYPSSREKKVWMSLVAIEHGAATFDAYTTRQALDNGAHEANPLLRPVAGSAALYPAIQLFPIAMDYLGWKLIHSQNRTLHKLWWLPQVASTVGSVAAGVHNLGN